MNCEMAALKRALERAGYDRVKTVLASGNVAFDAPRQPAASLERKLERAMHAALGGTFPTFVRTIAELEALLASDPWRAAHAPAAAKRVVTFLRAAPHPAPKLPVEQDQARIFRLEGTTAFTTYVPAKGPVFMALIEKTFGKEQTTRTWGTLEKVARA